MPDAPEDAKAPIWAGTADQIANDWGVTIRRVRQLAEEGRLRRCGRGMFDMGHGGHVSVGAAALGQDKARGVHGDVLAAVGWLRSFGDGKAALVDPDNLAAWAKLCARWGLSGIEASGLIAAAAALLGDRCPKFERGNAAKCRN